MKRDRWQDIDRLLGEALERPRTERSAFLAEACGDDENLRLEVNSLLGSAEAAEDFIEIPVTTLAAEALANQKILSVASQQVGHYQVISLLGAGGMGEVYLAQDTRLNRKVALKLLPERFTSDPERVRRFEREGRAASALNHPNIVTIHDIGQADGSFYIATELVDGQTLRQRLAAGKPLEVREAIEVARQVAAALSAAHSSGILHRDIKPENIMLRRDGYVKVLDFGLAKLTEQSAEIGASDFATRAKDETASGVVLGTLQYMSPEQVRGMRVDARTDIFSLGVVLYEMIAGKSPFAGATTADVIAAILEREPPPLAPGEATPELGRIVKRSLRKECPERYQSAGDLLNDLQNLREELSFAERLKAAEVPLSSGSDGVIAPDDRPEGGTHAGPVNDAVRDTAYSVLRHPGRNIVVTAAVLLLLAVIGAAVYWSHTRSQAITSLAVLPFVNVNSDADTEYLADGITEGIIAKLAQIPNLKVMSRSAVFHDKAGVTDARTRGRELGVEAVLMGQMVKHNETLTIRLELADARDNSHIWGEQYNYKLADLLAIQQQLPVAISEALRFRLGSESKARLTKAQTESSEAYHLYLQGRFSWHKWTPDGARRATEFFEAAVRKDPNYALAYCGLSDVYLNFGDGLGPDVPQKEAQRRAKEAATKALALDPTLGEAHSSWAQVLLYVNWDFAGAEKEFKQAIALSPSDIVAHHLYSHYLSLVGRVEESLEVSRTLFELDPVSDLAPGHLGYVYLYARRYDDAMRELQSPLLLQQDLPRAQLADTYYQKGMFGEAVEGFLKDRVQQGATPEEIAGLREAFTRSGITGYLRKRIEQIKGGRDPEGEAFWLAGFYSRLNEREPAFEWLETAYRAHLSQLVRTREDVAFDNLRSDPRFSDLLRRIGLPPL
jgi:eukaryotic-like serine/threonine-protein kinase